MKPTPEQLEECARLLTGLPLASWGILKGEFRERQMADAQAAWEIIAPIVRAQVLEEAALACDSVRSNPADPRYAPQTAEARLAAALCAGSIRQL